MNEETPEPAGPARDFVGYGRQKPNVVWPNGAAVAVNIALAYEEGAERSIPSGDDRSEALGPAPAVANRRNLAVESVFEYGSRAGIWRLVDLLESLEIDVTLFAAAVALEQNPELCSWVRAGNSDVCAHGWRWVEPWELSYEEEKRQIDLAVRSIRETCGERPVGWRSRTGPSVHTRQLLVDEGGFLYDSDSYSDDLPYLVGVGDSSHLVIPYTLTYTEGRLVQPVGFTSPTDFYETCRSGIDELCREGKAGFPKMMSIGIHPRHTGQAGRMAGLRTLLEYALGRGDVWFATRGEIARYWLENAGSF